MSTLWTRAFALLLGCAPARFRDEFGAVARRDLEQMLREVEASGEGSVAGTGLSACLDLAVRLPREWWASARIRNGDRDRRHGPSHGLGESTMNVMREARLAARSLMKRPGFSVVAILTLALGIGANVAVFAIVDAVLIQPLPYEAADRIVEYRHHAPGLGLTELRNSEGMIAFYREHADFYEATAAYSNSSSNLVADGSASRVRVLFASPEIHEVLRVQPIMGRPFTDEDAADGVVRVALVTHGAWVGRFGSDPSIIGRTLQLDDDAVEVVGVMPEHFTFPADDIDVVVPLYVDPAGDFGTFGTGTVSRLVPGVSVEAAERRSNALISRVPEAFPDLGAGFVEQSGFNVTVRSLRDRMVSDVESVLWIVLGTVGFVLLIACSNVANLFLVRAESRQKEIAIRAALGAGRKSIAGSFLAESLLLGVAGGVVGVAFARGALGWLLSIADLPRSSEVSLDGSALALAAALSVVAGVVFGTLPMVRYAGRRFARILRDGGRGNTSGRGRNRARNVLVAGQLALALVLVVGSGLMLRSFVELRAVDVGFEADGVLTMTLNRNRGEDGDVAARYFQQAADRVAALPGVAMVGVTTALPLGSGSSNGGSFYIEDVPREEDALPPVALHRGVGPDYFRSMGIPLLEGRAVERADWEEPRAVVWVNRQFADTYLDGEALGRRVAWNDDGEDGVPTRWAEVVGVVADVREFGLSDDDLRPNAYFPLRTTGAASIEIESAFLTIKMADGQDPRDVVTAAQAEVRRLDANVPITATQTMDEVVAEAMEETSITMIVIAIATAMALFLGAIGLAGVISYVVGQRTREIGVRVALGAQAHDVRQMVLRQSLLVTFAGVALGLVGAFGLTRLMEAILFGVSTTDPLTFVAAPLLLVGVSLLATWVPVRRASRVDPIEALRAE